MGNGWGRCAACWVALGEGFALPQRYPTGANGPLDRGVESEAEGMFY
jgi:hypothetical protein